MKSFILLSCVFFSAFASAGGSIQLKGKIRSFDKQVLELADANYIYKLDRRAIASVQNPKSGQNIEVTVPFNAIKDVKKSN